LLYHLQRLVVKRLAVVATIAEVGAVCHDRP
jgi:hypothetical protein